jgi:TrmH RNA methyltransferase
MSGPWKSRPPREARPSSPYGVRPGRDSHAPGVGDSAAATTAPPHRRGSEQRLYGLNAVHAVFKARPEAIRKLYLAESRLGALKPLLAWCVKQRVGYRVVDDADLQKLAGSEHHEGVVAEVLRVEPQRLSDWLQALPAGPQLAIWLDGVGNPHNFGAILRSAAHFGVSAILLPKQSQLSLSGAAARVAEGGAEAIPLVRLGADEDSVAQLHAAGFTLAATVVRDGQDLFATQLPQRLIYVMGAEGEGMAPALAQACDLRLSIPGTGAVESLNVSAATAVFLSQWRGR